MADNIHDKILTSVTNAEQTVEMVPLCVNIAPLGKPNKNSIMFHKSLSNQKKIKLYMIM